MATTGEFHDYILEHLQKVVLLKTRNIMGEYWVYYQGIMIGDICDNCMLLKPTASVLRLLPNAERAYPYEGTKTLMVVVEDVENTALMREVLEAMSKELPQPKAKKKKKEDQTRAIKESWIRSKDNDRWDDTDEKT